MSFFYCDLWDLSAIWAPRFEITSDLRFAIWSISLTLQSLLFFDFLAFFVFRFPLLFWAFFLSFPRILGVPRREKTLVFFRVSLAFSKKARVGGSVLGHTIGSSQSLSKHDHIARDYRLSLQCRHLRSLRHIVLLSWLPCKCPYPHICLSPV